MPCHVGWNKIKWRTTLGNEIQKHNDRDENIEANYGLLTESNDAASTGELFPSSYTAQLTVSLW